MRHPTPAPAVVLISLTLLAATAACSGDAADRVRNAGDAPGEATASVGADCIPIPRDQLAPGIPVHDPAALAREFAEREAAGDFLRWTPWLAGAVLCPDVPSRPDVLLLVDGWSLSPLDAGPDRARFLVRWERRGRLTPAVYGTSRYRDNPGIEEDTLTLVRRDDTGWRVMPPLGNWHVRADTAFARFPVTGTAPGAPGAPNRQAGPVGLPGRLPPG